MAFLISMKLKKFLSVILAIKFNFKEFEINKLIGLGLRLGLGKTSIYILLFSSKRNLKKHDYLY